MLKITDRFCVAADARQQYLNVAWSAVPYMKVPLVQATGSPAAMASIGHIGAASKKA